VYKALKLGLVAPFFALRDTKRLDPNENGWKFEPQRTLKPFL
jgi:hypothetical protein